MRRWPVGSSWLLGLLCSACVSGSYSRLSINEPVPTDALHALQPGRDTLATCLLSLGAPVRVFEYRVALDRTSGMVLLWYWQDTFGWGFDVSVPIADANTRVFEFDLTDVELPGCALWFGPDLVLESFREGLVGDLLPDRYRPSPVIDA